LFIVDIRTIRNARDVQRTRSSYDQTDFNTVYGDIWPCEIGATNTAGILSRRWCQSLSNVYRKISPVAFFSVESCAGVTTFNFVAIHEALTICIRFCIALFVVKVTHTAAPTGVWGIGALLPIQPKAVCLRNITDRFAPVVTWTIYALVVGQAHSTGARDVVLGVTILPI